MDIKICRFCKNDHDNRIDNLCDECEQELYIVSREKFKGTGLEVVPQECCGSMDRDTLEQWREWAKRIDGGGGSYGPSRQSAIDDIFNAAWIGMKQIKSDKDLMNKSIAKMLRNLAKDILRRNGKHETS